MCSSRYSPSPSLLSWFVVSRPFWSVLFHLFELWRVLNLSTEGNQPIPHELADRIISWSRSQEPVLFVLLRFPIDWLQIGRWPLRGSSPTALWSCIPSLVAVGVDLTTNRKDQGWGRFSCHLCSSVSGGSRIVHHSTCGQSGNRGSSSPEPSFLTVIFEFDWRTVQGSSADSLWLLFCRVQNPSLSVSFLRTSLRTVRHLVVDSLPVFSWAVSRTSSSLCVFWKLNRWQSGASRGQSAAVVCVPNSFCCQYGSCRRTVRQGDPDSLRTSPQPGSG
jgi:hypothetical protein